MNPLVLDASVIVKWIVQDKDSETDMPRALALLESFRAGRISLVQPIHWLAEVAAVCVRLRPGIAAQATAYLYAMEIPVRSSGDVYNRACALSAKLSHHLFDTLYHAVALDLPETTLVTADRRYYRKARREGAIILLGDFSLGTTD